MNYIYLGIVYIGINNRILIPIYTKGNNEKLVFGIIHYEIYYSDDKIKEKIIMKYISHSSLRYFN